MPRYRERLPQLGGELFLTDGGLETTLIFLEGVELPCFAAVTALRDPKSTETLRAYFRRYLDIAAAAGLGFILDTPTWRANRDWGERLGYTPEALRAANEEAVAFAAGLRAEYDGRVPHVVLNGVVGPRGDGYDPGKLMTPDEAAGYHAEQIEAFAGTEADMISAVTMTNAAEATGIARAAAVAGLPSVISFTVETDGRLPTGQALGEAIAEVDGATSAAPAYYMVNCAHPSHFADVLDPAAPWAGRLRGVRTNASRLSHAELDQATELDDGDPETLGRENAELRRRLGSLSVFGGCCGTDHRHIAAICAELTR